MRGPTTRSGDGPTVEVTVNGELDAVAVRGLAVSLDCVVEQRAHHLVIDLTDCTFADASAVWLLVDTHRRITRTGGLLTLRCPSPQVRRILENAELAGALHRTPAVAPQPALVAPQPALVAPTAAERVAAVAVPE
ncbi:STAS domain-containing protein [Planosporangium thailandense]|uniref:STAS domain-containing protein n=2 Tax=Planosporangium thailandense TaxID=765197 RepID=A0ABX0Y188_9ACTN|nr:STAS domain-containing protein [Planosporangium thailandense]NJC71214.1 STAS domain-containing protein [Planosporangium thailandense]